MPLLRAQKKAARDTRERDGARARPKNLIVSSVSFFFGVARGADFSDVLTLFGRLRCKNLLHERAARDTPDERDRARGTAENLIVSSVAFFFGVARGTDFCNSFEFFVGVASSTTELKKNTAQLEKALFALGPFFFSNAAIGKKHRIGKNTGAPHWNWIKHRSHWK